MINKNYYNISFSRLAVFLIPSLLRLKIVVATADALVRPLGGVFRKFEAFTKSLDTSVNSQVCYMEAIINNAYDYYERRIFIRDAPINYDDFFVFDENNINGVMLPDDDDAKLWVDNGKLGTTIADFEIVFPKGFSLSGNEIKSLSQVLNSNKLASKKYRIVYEHN